MSRSSQTFSIFFACTLLAACANTTNPQAVADATQVNYDPYSRTATILSDQVSETNFPNRLSYRFRAGIQSGSQTFLQLYITLWSQTGWYFLSAANDIDGNTLPVLQIDQEVNSNATVEETIAVDLSRAYLEIHRSNGLNIKLSGKRGATVVAVPPAYVAGFLAKLDTMSPRAAAANFTTESAIKVLGVQMAAVTSQLADIVGLPNGKGLLIVSVSQGSPAARAGFKVGDIILKFDGHDLVAPADLQGAVKNAGDTAKADIVRGKTADILDIDFR